MIWLNDYTYCEPTIEENIYCVTEDDGRIKQSYFMSDEEIYSEFKITL